MLFTVNVETIDFPTPMLLQNLTPGYGAKSRPFTLSRGKLGYQYNLPQESETGLEVIPGKIELEKLIDLFNRCIHFVNVKEARMLGYKNFHWPGHVFANQPIYVQYTVQRLKPRLMCTDVDWLCELKDQADKTACSLTIKQRVYPA